MELRILQYRKKKGITQQQLADACATTQQQIAKIELGNVDPQLSTLKKIASALGCEIKDLFYSKREFILEITGVVRSERVDLRKCSLLELYTLCTRIRGMPPFHPYWEQIQIKTGKLLFKEEES